MPIINKIRSSIRLQALVPIGLLLVCLIASTVFMVSHKEKTIAEQGMRDRATLIAAIAARGVSDAVWNLDTRLGLSFLQALSNDPDYVGSEIRDDKDKVFAAHGEADAKSGKIITAKAQIMRTENGKETAIGRLELRLSTAKPDAANVTSMFGIAVSGAIAFFVVLGLLFLILRGVTNPISHLTKAMTALSSGDLRVDIPARDRLDEVGHMAKAMDVFKANAQAVERYAAEQASQKEEAERTRVALMHKVANEFETSMAGVIDRVVSSSRQMGSLAHTMASIMDTAADSAETVRKATNETASNVQTVAAAAEELSLSVSEIASRVNESADIAGKTANAADQTSETIADLADQAQKINSIVNLISEIASQTNLLALNATIEAARAGDAGKGFAVVASEVKSLASQTARATGDITQTIQSIQSVTQRAVQEIGEIAHIAQRAKEIAASIAAAVEQQSAATREISSSVNQASGGTQLVAHNICQVSDSVGSANSSSKDVLTASINLSNDFNLLQDHVQSFVAMVRNS